MTNDNKNDLLNLFRDLVNQKSLGYELINMLRDWVNKNNLEKEELLAVLINETAHVLGFCIGVKYSDIKDPNIQKIKIAFHDKIDKKIDIAISETHKYCKERDNQ